MYQDSHNAVRTVLAETNPVIRDGIQAALFRKGIRGVNVCKDMARLVRSLEGETVDLIVCDAELPGGDFCDLIQEIRQNLAGRNPFVVIIATTNDATLPRVRQLINAGVDHVVGKPMPMSEIVFQVNALVKGRKPFVATEVYVGPTRRAQRRADDDDAADHLIQVPNTMRSKVVDRLDDARLQEVIRQGVARVQAVRALNSSRTVFRIIKRVLGFYKGKGTLVEVRRDLDRLTEFGQDMVRRHRGTESEYLADLAVGLMRVTGLIASNIETPQRIHLNLLSMLGEVMRRVLATKETSVEIVQQIAEIIASSKRVSGGNADRPTVH